MSTYRERLAELPRGSKLLSVLAAALVFAWGWALWPREAILSVTFLDVRHGDCAFIRTPSGRTILIDAGAGGGKYAYNAGSKVVAPYLRRRGVSMLDLVVMTHPHEDHIGGMQDALEHIGARAVLDGGGFEPTTSYRRTLKLMKKGGAKYALAKRGQTISFPDGVRLETLNPDGDASDFGDDEDTNNHSIVLRLTYREASFIFQADAGTEAEAEMLRECENVRAQVLKVGHHGSEDATSETWLDAVSPSVAVISVGRRNSYGLPSSATLQRLADHHVRVFRTDRDGAVTITTDGERMRVSAMRR